MIFKSRDRYNYKTNRKQLITVINHKTVLVF